MNITKIAELTGHLGSVYALAQAASPQYFYSSGADGSVAHWDLQTCADAELFVRVPQAVYAMRHLPSSDVLLLAQKTGGLHIIDLKKRKEIKLLQLHQKEIFALDVFDDKVLCGSSDGKISAISALDFTFMNNVMQLDYSIRCITNLVTLDFFCVSSSDGLIRIVGKNDFKIRKILSAHTNSVFCLAFSPCGKYLVSGSRDAHLVVYDVANDFEVIKKIPAHYYTINSLAFSPCGNYLATASRDRNIRIWHASTFELLKVIDSVRNNAHKASVNKLWWSSYNDYLVSGGEDKKVMIWQISTP
jgi:WD40 repeat protein